MKTTNPYTRWIGLAFLFIIFETVNLAIGEKLPQAPWWAAYVMVALAGSFVGRAVSYMTIGEPVRGILGVTEVVPHSSGLGDTVEPTQHSGIRGALGELIACPLCSGTWAGATLLLLYVQLPIIGAPMLWTFSAACIGALLTRITEHFEWCKYYNWERTAYINRINQAQRQGSMPVTWDELSKVINFAEED